MDVIVWGLAGIGLYVLLRKIVAYRAAQRDIDEAVASTARGILEADSGKEGETDILAHQMITANLAALMRSLREAYGIKFVAGSYAEKYVLELEKGNHGYLMDAHDNIVARLRGNGSIGNQRDVLIGFLHKPEPDFPKVHDWSQDQAGREKQG